MVVSLHEGDGGTDDARLIHRPRGGVCLLPLSGEGEARNRCWRSLPPTPLGGSCGCFCLSLIARPLSCPRQARGKQFYAVNPRDASFPLSLP